MTMKRTLSVLFALMMIAVLALGICARDNTSVEAAYFNVKPNIDGNFSTDEWGQPTGSAIVYCGRNDYKYDDNDNVLVSDFCFFDPGKSMYTCDISFDFWLRWDEQYFYIGVVSKDQYGYAKAVQDYESKEAEWKYQGTWDGDVLQYGLDPAGANSSGDSSSPFGQFSPHTFVFGYLDEYLGTISLRNDAKMGELISGFKGSLVWHDGVWPSFGGKANSDAGYLVYELAVPYSSFDGNIQEGKTNGFGVTIARVSATPADATDKDGNVIGTGEYECWLSWGDGVMGSLKDQLPEFRCGSNSVILVDTPAVGAGAAEGPAVVEEPEAAEEPEEAEEPADADVEEPAEGEETAEDEADEEEVPAEGENEESEETAEDEPADVEEEDTAAAEEEKAEETEDAGNKAIENAGDAEENKEEAKSGLPIGAIIGIVAAVVVIAAVVIAVLAKKKK